MTRTCISLFTLIVRLSWSLIWHSYLCIASNCFEWESNNTSLETINVQDYNYTNIKTFWISFNENSLLWPFKLKTFIKFGLIQLNKYDPLFSFGPFLCNKLVYLKMGTFKCSYIYGWHTCIQFNSSLARICRDLDPFL